MIRNRRTGCYLLFAAIILSSCKAYRYYPPTANTMLFANKGEVQLSADAGTVGGIAKAGVAVTDNIAVTGLFQGAYSTGLYRVSEGEVGLGYYQFNKKPNTGLYIFGGTGFGSNFKYTDSTHTAKDYQGNFYRPFMQLNTGISNGVISGKFTGDVVFAIKASGLLYEGHHIPNGDPISSQYLLVEPALRFALGSRIVHFDFTTGIAIHPTFDGLNGYSNARTFPVNMSFGLRVLLNRKYNDETPVPVQP